MQPFGIIRFPSGKINISVFEQCETENIHQLPQLKLQYAAVQFQ